MGKKRKKNTEQTVPEADSSRAEPSGNAGRWVAVALLVLGTGVFLYAIQLDGPPSSPSAASMDHSDHAASTPQRDPGQTHQYRFFENPEAAHPLPVTLPPTQFQNGGIANSYAVAKEIPEVLAQQPCLCGCDNTSDDHRSLLDCYIDEHASTCMVCMKEAVFAADMTEAGKSAEWIRDAILRNEFANTNIGN